MRFWRRFRARLARRYADPTVTGRVREWTTTRCALRDPEVRATLMGAVTPDDMVEVDPPAREWTR